MEGLTEHPSDDAAPLYRSDEFRMYCFKVLPCSKRYCHDWTTCPFAHPSEKARRRDPRTAIYTGVACPEMKRLTVCPRGDACNFAHNVFEYWLHPSRYRTQLCNDGMGCRRKICFFAHAMEELRVSSVKVQTPDLDRYGPELLHYSFDSHHNAAPCGNGGHGTSHGASHASATRSQSLQSGEESRQQAVVQQQYERALQQHQHLMMVAASEQQQQQQQQVHRDAKQQQQQQHQQEQLIMLMAAEAMRAEAGGGASSMSLPTPGRASSLDQPLMQLQQQQRRQQQQQTRRHSSLDMPARPSYRHDHRRLTTTTTLSPRTKAQQEELVKLQLEAQMRQERQMLLELQQQAAAAQQQHQRQRCGGVPPPASQLVDHLTGSLVQLQASAALNDPAVVADLVNTLMQLLASAHQSAALQPHQDAAQQQQQDCHLMAALQALQQQQLQQASVGRSVPPVQLDGQDMYCLPPPHLPGLSLPSALERMASVVAPETPSRGATAPMFHQRLSDSQVMLQATPSQGFVPMHEMQVGSGHRMSHTMASPSDDLCRGDAALFAPSSPAGQQRPSLDVSSTAPLAASPSDGCPATPGDASSPLASPAASQLPQEDASLGSPPPFGRQSADDAVIQLPDDDLFSPSSEAALRPPPFVRPAGRVVPLSELQQTFKLLHDHQNEEDSAGLWPQQQPQQQQQLLGSKMACWSLSDSIVPAPRQTYSRLPAARGSLDLHYMQSLGSSRISSAEDNTAGGIFGGGGGLDIAFDGGGAHSLFSSNSGIQSGSGSGDFGGEGALGGAGHDDQFDLAALEHMFLGPGAVF